MKKKTNKFRKAKYKRINQKCAKIETPWNIDIAGIHKMIKEIKGKWRASEQNA